MLLISAVILLLLFAAAAGFLGAALLDPEKEYPAASLSGRDFALQQRIINQVSREVFRRTPKKESTIVLSGEETRSLLRLLEFASSAAKFAGYCNGMELRFLELAVNGNALHGVYPYDTGFPWLFGGVAYVSWAGSPEFDGERLRFDLHHCRIGEVPVPLSLAKKLLAEQLEKLHQSRSFEQFSDTVRKFSVGKDGSVSITYSPAKLLPLLILK